MRCFPSPNSDWRIANCLIELFRNRMYPNVRIIIGTESFYCHMIVLKYYSDMFRSCNDEYIIYLPPEKVTPRSFNFIYNWMLVKKPKFTPSNILEIYIAASFLRIPLLVDQCWNHLNNYFDEDAAFIIYLQAPKLDLQDIKQAMLQRVSKIFLLLATSQEFMGIDVKEVCEVLSSNMICVNTEIEVYMTAMRWIMYKWPEREPYIGDVLKCVRFDLIPLWFLLSLKKGFGCKKMDFFAGHPDVKRMIIDSLSHTNVQPNVQHLLEHNPQATCPPRQYVFDFNCPYHHKHNCPNSMSITYGLFDAYLKMLQKNGMNYWHTLKMADGKQDLMKSCCTEANRKTSKCGMLCLF